MSNVIGKNKFIGRVSIITDDGSIAGGTPTVPAPSDIEFADLQEAAFGDVGASYTSLGTLSLARETAVFLGNTLNQKVYLSLDGVTNHFVLYPSIGMTITLKAPSGGSIQTLYIKHAGVAPTSGEISIAYQK